MKSQPQAGQKTCLGRQTLDIVSLVVWLSVFLYTFPLLEEGLLRLGLGLAFLEKMGLRCITPLVMS
jgi:hypothetical protein